MLVKLALLALIVVVSLALPKESSEDRESGLSIYDGTSTKIKKHNYLVGIVYNGNFVCAGTIVSKNWVVTLAECVTAIQTTYQLNVVAGSSDGVTGTTYNVSKIVIHPNYNTATNLDYNYACLQIEGSMSFSVTVGKATLPSSEAAYGTTMVVAGYGSTKSDDNSSKLLQATMNWEDKSTCQSTYSSFITWTDRVACASSAKKMTLCKGDYGNAFVKSKVFYGMFAGGVTSGFCTSFAKPVLIADIFPVVDWISSTTEATVELE